MGRNLSLPIGLLLEVLPNQNSSFSAESVMEQDLSLLIGLLVALVVFISVTLLAVRMIRSKTRSSSIYNMASLGKS